MKILKKETFFSIQDIIPNIITKISSGQIDKNVIIEDLWKNIAGIDIGKAVYKGIKENNVYICVDCPARLYQWKIRKTEILKQFQKKCPEIQDVFFKIGKTT